MKKLLMVGLALVAASVANAYINWTAFQYTVNSGESYDVAVEAAWSVDTSVYIYKNGAYFAYAQDYGTAYAGGTTTDYGSQTVHYTANGYYDRTADWGYWDSDSSSLDVTIVVANTAPTITWVQNPASAAVNEWFNVQARGNDADGNLTHVYVWREWVPHAFNDGGNGYENYSDPNGTYLDHPGTITFMAQAEDSNGALSEIIFHTTNIYQPNRSPDNATISSGGVTQIFLGQSVSLTGTLHDPDGNLINHNLYYAAPGGAWTPILSGVPSDPTNSSISTSFTPNAIGFWQFHTNGYDGQYGGTGATLSINVVDGSAPSIPVGLGSSNVTSTTFVLNWSASNDNIGVTAYEVRRDSTSLGTTGSTSISVQGLTQGTSYSMTVRARDAAGNWSSWSSALTVVTFATPAWPVIIAHPQKQDAIIGGSASFSVSVDGTPPLSYQWRKNGANIPGATNSIYSISNVQTGQAGTYDVVVTNGMGSVTSNGATLSVTQGAQPDTNNQNQLNVHVPPSP